MNENDLRVIKTKQNIERALLQLLKGKSLDQITITELCEASEISRRTFYLHYESVQKLFHVLIDRLLRELDDSIIQTKQTRSGLFDPHMTQLLQHVYDYRAYYDIVFTGHTHFALYKLFYNHLKTIVKSSYMELHEENDSLDFEVAYQANAIMGMILEWKVQNYALSVEEMNKLATSIFQKHMAFREE